MGPIQRRIRRAFIAHPDREFRTVELVSWCYPRLTSAAAQASLGYLPGSALGHGGRYNWIALTWCGSRRRMTHPQRAGARSPSPSLPSLQWPATSYANITRVKRLFGVRHIVCDCEMRPQQNSKGTTGHQPGAEGRGRQLGRHSAHQHPNCVADARHRQDDADCYCGD